MSNDNPLILEKQGVEWSFTFDLTHRPEYVHLTVRGKPSQLRTEHLVEAFQTLEDDMQDDAGQPYPIITDLRQDGSFSMEHLRALDAFREALPLRAAHVILLLEERQSLGSVFQMFVSVLTRTVSRSRVEVALSLEEAVEKIRARREP